MKIKNIFKDFVNSFKPKITLLYIIIFDLLFYGVSVLLLKGASSYLSSKSNAIKLPQATDIASLTQAQLEPIAAQLQSLVISILGLVIFVFIFILVTWSLSRGLIYCLLLKKKFTKKYFKKFILLNLFLFAVLSLILIAFIAIGSVLSNLIPYKYILYVIILAIAYYLSIDYIFFTKKNKVFDSIGKALTFGTKNLPKLFLPCLFILIILMLLSRIQLVVNIPAQAVPFLSLVIFVVFMAWARNYFVQEVNKIKGS